MNRFSTFCWFAVLLGLFPVGQSQWLSSGGHGSGRASAGDLQDIGQDESHFGVDQGTDSSVSANQTSNVDSDSASTRSSVTGQLFFPSFDFGTDSAASSGAANHGIWADNFGFVGLPAQPPAVSLAGFGVPVEPAEPGTMDGVAYAHWADRFGQSGDDLPGDFNADGTVDLFDRILWLDHFGQIYTPPAAGAAAARAASLNFASVPEPSGLLLLAMGLSSLILWRAGWRN